MPRDLIEKYINNPLALVVAGVILLALLGLLIFILVRWRRSRRVRQEQMRAEFAAAQRESQILASAQQLEYRSEPEEVCVQIGQLLGSLLSAPVIAIYAGRPHDDRLNNRLPQPQQGTGSLSGLPPAIAAELLADYRQPQISGFSALLGSRTGEPAQGGAQEARRVAVLPWHGFFAWNGLVVARAPNELTPEALWRCSEVLDHAATRLSIALELENRGGEAERAERLSGRLMDFARSVVRCQGESAPLLGVARELAYLMAADSAAIWQADADAGIVTLLASNGLRTIEFLPVPYGQGFVGRVAETGLYQSAIDAPADPRCLFPTETRESGIGSYLGVPVNANGQLVAVVEVHTTGPHFWSEKDAAALESAGRVASEVISRVAHLRGQLRVESAYLGLSEALQRLRSRDDVMEAAVEVLGHAMGVSRAVIIEFETAAEGPRPRAVRYEYRDQSYPSCKEGELPKDLGARVIGGLVAINSSADGSLLPKELVVQLQIKSELAVPIKMAGSLCAVIYLHQCDRIREWHPDEIEFAQRVGGQLSLSLGNVLALEAASRDAELAREESKRLSEVNARALGLIDSLPEPVIGLDEEGRLTFFNTAARNGFGLQSEDVGRMVDLIDGLAMSDESAWERLAQYQAPSRFESQVSTQGNPTPISVSVAPVRNEGGVITGRIVVLSDIAHVGAFASREVSASIAELEQRLGEVERALMEARAEEARARTLAERARGAEAEARAAAEAARRVEADMRKERDQMREDEARTRRSAQQLLDVNRLKSEFIVKAGRDLEGSLQALLGSAEMLEQGAYGKLSDDQLEAARGICEWARHMKGDVAWMVEYSSTRSARAESQGQSDTEEKGVEEGA